MLNLFAHLVVVLGIAVVVLGIAGSTVEYGPQN